MMEKLNEVILSTAEINDANQPLDYLHASVRDFNEFHIEGSTKSLKFLAELLLLLTENAVICRNLTDKLPQYDNRTDEYSRAEPPFSTLKLINIDKLDEDTAELVTKIHTDTINQLECEKFHPASVTKHINIPKLKPNQYPETKKLTNAVVIAGPTDRCGFLILNTAGIDFLATHLAYNCYIGEPDSGAHTHFSKVINHVSEGSLDIGIYNLDFMPEPARSNYYKCNNKPIPTD